MHVYFLCFFRYKQYVYVYTINKALQRYLDTHVPPGTYGTTN